MRLSVDEVCNISARTLCYLGAERNNFFPISIQDNDMIDVWVMKPVQSNARMFAICERISVVAVDIEVILLES